MKHASGKLLSLALCLFLLAGALFPARALALEPEGTASPGQVRVGNGGTEVPLTVKFNDNKTGGTALDQNDMKTAVEDALSQQTGTGKASCTTIRLTGDAAEITKWNWRYLLSLYQTNSGWTNLTILDLSGLGSLRLLEDGTGEISEIQNLRETRFPSGLKAIGGNVFYKCSGLTNVAFPAGLESIGDRAFSQCSALTGADLSACTRLTSIGDRAFSSSGLTGELVLPAGLKSIGDWAFNECSGLTGMTIPKSLESIGNSAFLKCSGLTAFTVAAGNRQYAGRDGVLYSRDGKTLYQYPPKKAGAFAVPEGVTVIGDSAFYQCGGLTGVTFPEGLNSIGTGAFYQCGGLTGVAFPESLNSIGQEAFSQCRGLTGVAFPEGLTSIGQNAFYWCLSLTTLTFLGDAPPAIGGSAFDGVIGLGTIYYPQGESSEYTEAWKNNLWFTFEDWTLTPGCRLTVKGGTGSGIYQAGDLAPIRAHSAPAGQRFDRWVQEEESSDSAGSFANASAESTTFTMPGSHVTVRAAYRATGGGGPANHSLTASAGEGGSIEPSGTVAVAQGGSQEFTFAPQENWWLAGVDIDGTVQKAAGNSYTFADVTEDHTIRALFLPFTDMNAESWYAPDAAKLFDRKLMRGVAETKFGPNLPLTREMLVTVLWRVAGEPESQTESGFTDVKPGAYYKKAVVWAKEAGVVYGISKTAFGVGKNVSRQDIASMLWRQAGSPKSQQELSGFSDAGQIAEYALPALKWAVEKGIVSGKGSGILAPASSASRAETAALVLRFLELE